MADVRTPVRVEGEQEALLFIFQIVAGAGAWLLVAWFVSDRLLGELLGFVALCAAQFPFARRTWAAEVPPARYWKGVAIGTAVAAGLRLVLL